MNRGHSADLSAILLLPPSHCQLIYTIAGFFSTDGKKGDRRKMPDNRLSIAASV
jgi:hypothetical protein